MAQKDTHGGLEDQTENTGIDVNQFSADRNRNIDEGKRQGQRAEMTRQNAIRAFFDRPQFADVERIGEANAAAFQDLMASCLAKPDVNLDLAREYALDMQDGMAPPIASVPQIARPDALPAIQPVMKPFQPSAGHGGFGQPAAKPFHVAAGADQRDKLREAMTQATVARMGVERQDGQNPWRGHNLLALARDCLVHSGQNPYGMSDKDIAMRVLSLQTTSDFPVVLENTMHKLVLSGFESAPGAWRQFCKVGSVSDLREWKRITPGLLSDLTAQDEHGNYRSKPIPDGEAESISAELIGNIIGVTANVLINDDLNYIETRARGIGGAAERTVNRKVFSLLAANPTMSDGEALFSIAHDNLAGSGTGTVGDVPVGAPDLDSVDLMTTAMAEQKAPAAKDDPDGTDQYLDLSPHAAVANRRYLSTLRVINGSTVNITQSPGADPETGLSFQGLVGETNVMAGTFAQIAVSVLAEALPWYVFASPDVAPIIEVVFLNGQQVPEVTMEQDFNTSGLKYKVEYPHGVGAIGWRGAIKNPGA